MSSTPEFWLQGKIEGVPALLQPVVHAFLQAQKEIHGAVSDFPEEKMWDCPAGAASVAFHLQHIPGVIDRLFTYARDQQLDNGQLAYLAAEGKQNNEITVQALLAHLGRTIDKAIVQLKSTDPGTLTDARGVGRKQIPSTIGGLLFHAAEHTMRHTGQLLVTVAVLRK